MTHWFAVNVMVPFIGSFAAVQSAVTYLGGS